MKKRIFSFVLALFTMALIMPPGVYAEGTDVESDLENMYKMQFTVDEVTVGNDDETVTVNITLTKNGGFAAMNYQLLYDKDVLSLEEQPVPGSIIEAGYMGGPLEEGKHMGSFVSEKNVHGDGVILTYEFKINPEAAAGTHDIILLTSGVANLPNGETVDLEVLDENFISITTDVTNGSVTIPGYSVTYNANGGSGAPEGVVKSKNVPVIISSVKPERNGYVFLGWATTSSAKTPEYMAGGKYEANADVTLYAVWEKAELIAGTMDVTVETVEAKVGDKEVTVNINIANHPGFGGMTFDVVYDSEHLEYVSYEQVMAINGIVIPATYENKVNFQVLTNVENVIEEGTFVSLKFNVLETATDGLHDISLVPDIFFKYSGENAEEAKIVVNVTNGGVEIISQLLGDLNLDEVVDMNDAILLLQHSMFSSLYPLDYKGSVDFTKDGSIDMNDAILLLQYSMFPDLYPID